MAKARPIPELGKDDPFAVAAAKVVEMRTRELADEAEGVLDTGDIERVHDMRVATRRLRAALEVFEACFPKRALRAALKEVKALADALGERRDPDVHIAELTDFEAQIGAADRPGVRSFIRHLRDEQAEANVALAPYVTADRVAALCRRLDELAADAEALIAPPEEPELETTPATSSASPPGVPGPGEPVVEIPAVTNGGEPH